jgi:hypothetical protein
MYVKYVSVVISMTTENPRVFVTFKEHEYRAVKAYADETSLSLSKAVSALALQSLKNKNDSLCAIGKVALIALSEKREDALLADKAMQRISGTTDKDYLTLNKEEFAKIFDEIHGMKHA